MSDDSTTSHVVRGNLAAALTDGREQLTDRPAKHLLRAVRQLRADFFFLSLGVGLGNSGNYLTKILAAPAVARRHENLDLLEALIGALEGKTEDGFSLKLHGPKGRPTSSTDSFEKEFEIVACVIDAIESGSKYDAAVEMVAERFKCGRTKVTTAYGELKEPIEYVLKLDDESHDKALVELDFLVRNRKLFKGPKKTRFNSDE